MLLLFIYHKSKIGKVIRAVSNNMQKSYLTGINADWVILIAFALGSGLAALSGVLVSLDTDINPSMGFYALLMGVIAVIIGGIGSFKGTAIGALILSFAQNLGGWKLPTQWQDAIAFMVMLLFLLFRPQGLFGKNLKKADI